MKQHVRFAPPSQLLGDGEEASQIGWGEMPKKAGRFEMRRRPEIVPVLPANRLPSPTGESLAEFLDDAAERSSVGQHLHEHHGANPGAARSVVVAIDEAINRFRRRRL